MDEQKENDKLESVEDIKFIVDGDIASQYSEFNVDYSDGFFNKGFVIRTNGPSSSC